VGASPFRSSGNESREETMRRIQQGDFETRRPAWQNLSQFAQDLVRKFLVVEEFNRLTSRSALRHPWVEPARGDLRSPAPMRSNAALLPSPRGSGGGVLDNYSPYGLIVVTLLEKFTRLDAMQQLVLIICAQTMAECDLINCQTPVPWYDLFFALDRNEDGQLSFHEFTTGLRQLLGSGISYNDEQLDSLVRGLDLDCSGQIEWIEWVAIALLAGHHVIQEAEPLCTAFRLLDRPSGDCTVGAADLLAVINSDSKSMFITSTMGREQVLRILSRWVPTPPNTGGKKSPYSFVSPPSMKLEDMRKVLDSCLEETPRPRSGPPVDNCPKPAGGSWFRSVPGCCSGDAGDKHWAPDAKNELNVVMVHQQRAFSKPKGGRSPKKDPFAGVLPNASIGTASTQASLPVVRNPSTASSRTSSNDRYDRLAPVADNSSVPDELTQGNPQSA